MVVALVVYLLGLALYVTFLSSNMPEEVKYVKMVTVGLLYPIIILLEILTPIYSKIGIRINFIIGIGYVTDDDEPKS